MRTFLSVAVAIIGLTLEAQTNMELKFVSFGPSPEFTNYNRITLQVTNIHPNETYALLFARRLTNDAFVFYITFSSPSNSLTILRDTTNSIPARFYLAASTNIFSSFAAENWDDHDLPGGNSDIVNNGGDGDPYEFPGFMDAMSRNAIDSEWIRLIAPPTPEEFISRLRNR